MTDLSWLLGEQWSITRLELRCEAERAKLLVSAPTLCTRSKEIERIFGSTETRKFALAFAVYGEQLTLPLEEGDPATRLERLKATGWHVEDVQEVESAAFVALIERMLSLVGREDTVLVDITGLPVGALAMMVRCFKVAQQKVTWVYAEPGRYIDGAQTEFATGLQPVGPLRGFAAEGIGENEGALVVLAGYDSAAIKAVTDYRKGAHPRYLIIPFPSLQADMYQENVLRIQRVRDSTGVDVADRSLGVRIPAFDAWGVVEQLDMIRQETNSMTLSVAPLSTKAQTLGVLLWWCRLGEKRDSVSLVVPQYKLLVSGVSEGMGRIWRYKEFH